MEISICQLPNTFLLGYSCQSKKGGAQSMTTTRSRLAKRLTTTLNIANSNLIVIIIATTKMFSKLLNVS